MSEITIVTAYFDINRKNWKGFERDNNKYINYFKFWARIQNNLIIYTSKEFADTIYSIRKNFGLENKTHVVAIDDVFSCDKEIYQRMKKVMSNDILLKFHFPKETKRPNAWNVNYNYITYLKPYFVNKAIKDYNLKNLIAWWDFGFNHGGELGILDPNDFDFLWQYNFSPKIHLFSTNYYKVLEKNRPIFDMVRSLDSYIVGGIIVAPSILWADLTELTKTSMISLTRCGLCEADELIFLMSYYEKPDLFDIHDIDFWYDGVRKFGGKHLKVQKQNPYHKYYQIYKYRARVLWGYGYHKLSLKYYKLYLYNRIKNI